MVNFLSGLDFYKLTMSQLAFKKAPKDRVTFTLKNRGTNSLLERVSVGELRSLLASFQEGLDDEARWLSEYRSPSGAQIFDPFFVRNLWIDDLPEVNVEEWDADLLVHTTGQWPLVTFWETIVMSAINDLYFANPGTRAFAEGHRRLSWKIDLLREYPGIRFSDFGTRRRFSLKWQETVVERLVTELPGQFVGSSNPYIAKKFGIPAIGTFAHELPMVYAAQAQSRGENPVESQNKMFDDWFDLYGEDYSIALTDTFGTDFFWKTFGKERAEKWRGLRHDSGDPFEFGYAALRFYESHGIDNRTKTIVFSDGLNIYNIIELYHKFSGSFNLVFGWGTSLMNDVGLTPNNIVMKATRVGDTPTVKLSDDAGKHTGPDALVKEYQELTTVT